MRRVCKASRRCSSSGQPVRSITLSSMRTAVVARADKPTSSKCALSVNGCRTSRDRSMEPRQQLPWAGRGCSPQGLVAYRVSRQARLLSRFKVSRNSTPGSPWCQAARARCCQRALASGSPACTCRMKASVSPTERLKCVSPPAALASMNAPSSGWSTCSTPIKAPGRAPSRAGGRWGWGSGPASRQGEASVSQDPLWPPVQACAARSKACSAGSTWPEARAEKSRPTPPPSARVRAVCARASASVGSPVSPALPVAPRGCTKQLIRGRAGVRPAPARMRPAGMKPACSASSKRAAQRERSPGASASASARATRWFTSCGVHSPGAAYV